MSYPKDPYYQNPAYPPMGAPPQGQFAPPAYPTAPPPYSTMPTPMPGPSTLPAYPAPQYGYGTGMQAPPQPYMPGPAPPAYNYQPSMQNRGYPVQQGYNYSQTNAVAMAQFDSGARFDGIAGHNIPPPPPGCAPNAAQMATAQGGTVVASQKKASWFSGGSGGGVSFW